MKPEPLDKLGLGENSEYVRVEQHEDRASNTKEGKGFVAGTGVAPGKFKGGAGWGIGWLGSWGEKENGKKQIGISDIPSAASCFLISFGTLVGMACFQTDFDLHAKLTI